MHVFPQLRKLEHKYLQELAVIGVHSAKFTSEKVTENLRKAMIRYEVEHPVVNDKDFRIWSEYGVRAWPSLFVLDPEGKILGRHEGEITFEAFDHLIGDMLEEFDAKGLIDRSPVPGVRGREAEGTLLSFPEKVLADEASNRLVIADTNHNRILVATLDGEIRETIGDGNVGFKDGRFSSAQLNHPRGVVLDGDVLYIADTENHVIRKADLNEKRIETLAGTGEQARMFHGGGKGRSIDLSSPWDVTLHKETLYIAMAGFHQLWSMDVGGDYARPHAGNGRENISDGPLLQALLAQPNGIATDGEVLYFADSETSSIRKADLDADGGVSTIVGMGLFEFGDVDATGDEARLQHPQGVSYHDGVVYVADTYNNKIKRLFPKTHGVASFLGSGDPGLKDGTGLEVMFHEPGGLSAVDGKLYIADTNNHAIRVTDLETGEVSTLDLKW